MRCYIEPVFLWHHLIGGAKMERASVTKSNYQAILFPILDVLLNGGNLLIHLYISWYLTTGDYGILNAFSSLLFVLMIFGMSMQTYIAKRVSSSTFNHKEVKNMYEVTKGLIVIVCTVMVLLTGPMTQLLRGTYIQYGLILLTFVVQSRLSFLRGMLQGNKAFIQLNASFYFEMIGKLTVLIPLIRIYKSIELALFSILVGMVVSYITTRIPANKYIKKELEMTQSYTHSNTHSIENTVGGIRKTVKGFLKVFSTQIYFYYFTAVVLILTNYFMGEASGLYAVSTRYGQIFIHIGLSIITVLIPYTSSTIEDMKTYKRKVGKLLLLYSGIGLVVLMAYVVIMPLALKWFFGPSYQGAEPLLIPQAVAYYVLSIAFYMASMEMVSGKKEYILTLTIFSVLLLIALLTWHTTLLQIVYVEGSVYTLMALVLIIRFFTRKEH